MDWLETAKENFKRELETGMKIYKNKAKAIEYAKKQSCAGLRTIKESIQEFFKK